MKIKDITIANSKNKAKSNNNQLFTIYQAADSKVYNALQKELSKVETRMFDVRLAGKNIVS